MNEYHWADLRIGQIERFSVTLTASMMEAFLSLSGDVNPLHVSAAYAVDNGFKDKVCYGMLIGSFYSTLVGVYLPGKYSLLQGLDVDFHKPSFIGDGLTIQGEIVYVNESYGRIEIKGRITNQNEEVVSRARIRTGLLEYKR